jgi:hypothetical protein
MLHAWVQEKFVEEDVHKAKKNAHVDPPFIANYTITFMQKTIKVSTTKNA